MMSERREMYDSLAKDNAAMKEILAGETTFSESLDQIVAGMEEGVNYATAAFAGWYALVKGLEGDVLAAEEVGGIISFYDHYSKPGKKAIAKQVLTGVAMGALMAVRGTLLKRNPLKKQIGTLYQLLGGGSITASGALYALHTTWERKDRPEVEAHLETLHAAAAGLDDEIRQLYAEEPITN